MFAMIKRILKKIIKWKTYFSTKFLYLFSENKIEIPEKNAFNVLNAAYSYRPCIIEADNNINKQVDLMIIIPTYNVERYIKECIDSVLRQKTKFRYKIVVVDDGSTDHTRDILNLYSKEAQVIYQENGGVASARNTALKNIIGNYVMFIDGDDILQEGAIEDLMRKAIDYDADIVEGSSRLVADDGKVYGSVIYEESKDAQQTVSSLRGQPWGKVIRAELFQNIKYPEKYDFEDSIFAYCLYPSAEKKYTVKKVVYDYRYNQNGITRKITQSVKAIDTYYISVELWKYWKNKFEITKDFNIQVLNQIVLNYHRTRMLEEEILKAGFVVETFIYKELFDSEFKLDGKYKKLDYCIRSNDWGRYRILCKGWSTLK